MALDGSAIRRASSLLAGPGPAPILRPYGTTGVRLFQRRRQDTLRDRESLLLQT